MLTSAPVRLRIGLLLFTVAALILWNLRFGPYRLTKMTQSAAAEAVARAGSEFKVDLDFTEASIAKVESIAARLYQGNALSEPQREEWSKLLGVYVGEVARRNHGGEWLIPKDGPFAGALVLQTKQGQSSPPSKVYKRLTNGEEDNLEFYYKVMMRPRE